MAKSKKELVLFLACSFAKEPVDGISDLQLAHHVKELIESESGGHIVVRITQDPYTNYISEAVLREIYGADLVLCLFTRRTYDHVAQFWLTSTYVVSEAAAALAQFPMKQGRKRLFGIREEGVDPMQLGLAFPRDKVVETFQRSDIESLRTPVRRILQSVLDRAEAPRDECECLSMDKYATVCRDGWVQIETRFRFRITKRCHSVTIPHNIWRVSKPLPSIKTLLGKDEANEKGILRTVPLSCGLDGEPSCRLSILPDPTVTKDNERRFLVETNKHEFGAGEELEYSIAWEYPGAFANPAELKTGCTNTIGMCLGQRMMAEYASLTILFERDIEHEFYDRILREPPRVAVSNATMLPGVDPVDFWYSSPTWREQGELKRCPKTSCARYDVYRWSTEQFSGMTRVTFVPYTDYFESGANGSESQVHQRHVPQKG